MTRPGGPPLSLAPPPRAESPALLALSAALGFAAGSSVLWGGFYAIGWWGPISLVVFASLLGVLVGAPRRIGPLARSALAGLVVLAGLALASILWAESSAQAIVDAHRWALYAAAFALAIWLPARARCWMLGAAAAGVLLSVVYMVASMVTGGGAQLFPAGRLSEPLGYVNGQAGFLLAAMWPAVAVAERASRPVVAGLGAAAATVAAGLVVLTQSRGAALAAMVSAAIVVAAVPGRRTRAWLLLVIGVAVAAAFPILERVYESAPGGRVLPPADVVREAAIMLLVAALAAGAVWAAVASARSRVQRTPLERRARSLSTTGLAVIAAAALVVAVAAAPRFADRVQDQWQAFRGLDTSGTTDARFTSGGGNRHDYWRVAMRTFESDPLTGVGAGNFDTRWFALRRVEEDVRQPHSLQLQALAELGIPGGLALATWLIVLAVAVATTGRAIKAGARPLVAVAATGVLASWLVQTSVDWLHLLPGLTVMVMAAAATLVTDGRAGGVVGALRGGATAWARLAGTGAAALLLLALAVGTGRTALGDHYRERAVEALGADPREAARLASTSLRLQRDNLPALYVRAAALARENRYFEARRVLDEAVAAEPSDFVTYALLGDLAVRRGDLEQARRDYRAALERNPRDPGLRALAADPSTATGGG